jgi:erythronate-4-phosphate dehydrogenase
LSKAPLKIVADRNIPYADVAFGSMGQVTLLPAGELTAAAVRDADVVLVRSTVKVNEALLGASRAQFVATATIGTDHMDIPWLEAHHLAWAAAEGSNAGSVAQWFAAALLTVAEKQHLRLAGMTIGIVGVGAIGCLVERIAHALGCAVLRCDPPRARTEGDAGYVSLDDLLASSDVVTFHVPLTTDGPDATHHLLDRTRLARVSPSAILVNSSRGPVIDTAAVAEARREGRLRALILDVFENEPNLAPEVVESTDLATPHIAGHSLDGKAAGTHAVYQAACAYFGLPAKWAPKRSLPPPPVRNLVLDTRSMTDEATALSAIRRFYRIEDDDAALRRILRQPAGERAAAFQKYRASYPERRELVGLRLQLRPMRPRGAALLGVLGAQLTEPPEE